MASRALGGWKGVRCDRLDELEAIHAGLTGTGPGRRWLTEQLDRAYVLALASQFQGFARDLHSEAAAHLAATSGATIRPVFEASLTVSRYLDRGNATAGNLGSDFARLGFDFWDAVYATDKRNRDRRARLDQIMIWRNSIAHDSPIVRNDLGKVVGTKPTLTWGRRWRRALSALTVSFDRAVGDEVGGLVGRTPW